MIRMKKFTALFLVFSILLLSMPLAAKERKGADLIIQRTDYTQIRGELIAVKQTSLVLLERESGGDVTINVDEIGIIVILKKSKALFGVVLGVLIGGISGALIGRAAADKEGTKFFDMSPMINIMLYGTLVGVIGAIIGGSIGGVLGAGAGKGETIQIEGKSDAEIQEILEKLRKKARIKNAQ